MNDLEEILHKTKDFSFLDRSIAREVSQMMLRSKDPGEVKIEASDWSSQWNLPESDIWSSLDRLCDAGIWRLDHSRIDGPYLHSKEIKSAAKSIVRIRKKKTMREVKETSQAELASRMTFNQAKPTWVSEMVVTIPPDRRDDALRAGYSGWIPCDKFVINGIGFRLDPAFIAALAKEHEGVCMQSALSEMFRDLAFSPNKPTLKQCPYWIKNWFARNSNTLAKEADTTEKADIAALIESKMDSY